MARVTSGLATLALAALTTNVLTTHGRGIYTILSTAAGLAATVVEGGTAILVADLIHRRHEEPVLQGAALAIALGSAIVLVPIAGCLSLVTTSEPLAALLWTAALASLLIYSYYEMYLAQARGDVLRVSLVWIGKPLFPLIASAIVAIVFKATFTTLIAAWAVGTLVLAAIQFAGVLARGIVIRHAARVGFSVISRSVAVSISNALATLWAQIDVLIVAVVISASAAGVYSIPVALSTGLLLLSRSLLTATYHSIMTAPDSEARKRLGLALRHSVLVVLGGGCLSVPLVALGAGFVFGNAYSEVWQPYAILIVASLGNCVGEMLRHFLITRLERRREYVLIITAGLIINGVLAVVGAAEFGLLGAAASTAITYASGALALVAVCSRLLSVPMRSLVVPRRSDLAMYSRALHSLRPRSG